ncbi:MAG: Mur ligase family protein [Patescibacteria group bacterium]
MLHALKKFIPQSWLDVYHYILSYTAAMYYGNPSRELIVIGVTGTNGKTTTTYMIAKALESDTVKTGCTSTAIFKVGDKEWLNDKKMTMLGRFQSQKLLRDMVAAGCKYAVIETSSQGILQHRHKNIVYDICVFTNLTPEHIEAHGGFNNYKQAKIELFRHTASLPSKTIDGQVAPRAAILNSDDEHAADFAISDFPKIIWYGTGERAQIRATDIAETAQGLTFKVAEQNYKLNLLGRVNVCNALAAAAAASGCGITVAEALNRLSNLKSIPGRFELIDAGQNFTVLVDYAPEPESVQRLYEAIRPLNSKRIIHVLGSCGGGRDVARRPVLGRLAAQNAAIVIITNEDPYDDDPKLIIDQVAEGAVSAGKIDGQNLFRIMDRREAVSKAISLAQAGDLVLLTGKGSEQAICVAGGHKIPWDEREEARKAIKRHIAQSS